MTEGGSLVHYCIGVYAGTMGFIGAYVGISEMCGGLYRNNSKRSKKRDDSMLASCLRLGLVAAGVNLMQASTIYMSKKLKAQ